MRVVLACAGEICMYEKNLHADCGDRRHGGSYFIL